MAQYYSDPVFAPLTLFLLSCFSLFFQQKDFCETLLPSAAWKINRHR
jgi:hypothetical protein